MPTTSGATTIYKPVLVPDQNYNRLERESPVPKSIDTNTNEIPEVSSVGNLGSTTNRMKIALLFGALTIGTIAAGVLPAVIASQVFPTITTNSSTVTTLTSSSATVNNSTSSSSTSAASSTSNSASTSASISGSTSASSSSSSSTSNCPTNTCSYSTYYTLSSGYFGLEHVNINCSQTLSNLTAYIYVQKTVNATYSNQYNTFWSGTANQTYITTGSQIIYSWITLPGQTISSSGFPYYIEAQFNLQGTNQTVTNDTYTVITQAACNGQVLTYSGHF